MIPLSDEENRRLEGLAQAFADAYVEFVHNELSKHINPRHPLYNQAVILVLMQTGAFVGSCTASAVITYERAIKASKAKYN